jgi:uncharacterized protein (DUF302 family)
MSDYGRRIVIDSEFRTAVGELSRAIRDEGLQEIARIDVREYFSRQPDRDFRRYVLMQAWSPNLALEALRHCPDAGTMLLTTFSVYELDDHETVVVVNEPMAPLAEDAGWREDEPMLAELESERVARVFDRLQRRKRQPPALAA